MSISFDTSIQYLKGVGPKMAECLSRRGIQTVGDLLEFYPRTYEDRRAVHSISSLRSGQRVVLKAQMRGVRTILLRSEGLGRKKYEIKLEDSSGSIVVVYFRLPYHGFISQLTMYDWVQVIGEVKEFQGRLEFHHPELAPYDKNLNLFSDQLIPLYPQDSALTSKKIQKLINTALVELKNELIPEYLPPWIIQEAGLIERGLALRKIHQPPVQEAESYLSHTSSAHRRLIFDEFFRREFFWATKKKQMTQTKSIIYPRCHHLTNQLLHQVGFSLTEGQCQARDEIALDLESSIPMHRLLQGDVGCGKTLVALLAAVQVIEGNGQVAFMAPTEILAEQHYNQCKRWLEPLGIKVGLLVGPMKTNEKQSLHRLIAEGKVHLIVGTQALIQAEVQFQQLGLVMIDEQHRFGVLQRMHLKNKGCAPHFLIISATPIPRSLALTLYGDLKLSIIKDLPLGRKPILTRLTENKNRERVWDFVEQQLKKGHQAYVIYPLVEESETLTFRDAQNEWSQLVKRFAGYEVGLIHGQMDKEKKENVMMRFRQGQTQVLVATTVIEVGVDVPNANIIVIENSEKYGLSQLHQLRGRVGRGDARSYCVLLMGPSASIKARKRLETMEKTTDGFEIAEMDLQLRGPGEFLGTRQSGLPEFKLAHWLRDLTLQQQARCWANKVLELDPHLNRKEHSQLKILWESLSQQSIG